MKPRLLDLFCGAGGAAKGYQRAGFYVVGIDIIDQPNYCGDEFYKDDALAVLADLPHSQWSFDVIHASPPCHAYSTVTGRNCKNEARYPDLVAPTRALLQATGLPYVIENVVGAPLLAPFRLCGSSFGLDVRRHRIFEPGGWQPALVPPCAHHWQRPRFRSLDNRRAELASVVGVHGHLNYPGEQALREQAMDIDWMTQHELTQAIPPAYTEFIGGLLLERLKAAA